MSTPLDECPYADGLSCNQKANLCDRGRFDSRCLMSILRQINQNIQANNEYLQRQGMVNAVLWLFDNGYIKRKYGSHSADSLVKLMKQEVPR